MPGCVVADRGASPHAARTAVCEPGLGTAIPIRRNEAAVRGLDVERMSNRRTERRATATRYERTARSLLSALHLAAAFDWLKS